MAHSPKLLISSIFLVIVLFSSEIQARESQFFSKVSATTNNENTVVTVPKNNEQQEALNKQEQDPTFIPETQNGYGLYGHESSENIHATTTPTTTTTTTYTPYTTRPQETNSAYEGQQQNFGETRLQESGYATVSNENSNSNQYYNNGRSGYNNVPSYQENNNKYDGRGGYNKRVPTPGVGYTTTLANQENNNKYDGRGGYNGPVPTSAGGYTTTLANQENNNKYDGRGGYNRVPTPGGGHSTTLASQENINNNKYKYNNNGERQGMSDTRFLENGRYYYHVNNEQKYNPTQYEQNSRGVTSRNEKYNPAGGYYGNNNENTNSMKGYQNNQVVKEEFEENAEFEP